MPDKPDPDENIEKQKLEIEKLKLQVEQQKLAVEVTKNRWTVISIVVTALAALAIKPYAFASGEINIL